MEIKLTATESEEYFCNALCNGLDYIIGHGLEVQYKNDEYEAAKDSLIKANNGVCFEDTLMEILRQGNKLYLVDIFGDGGTSEITLKDVHDRVQTTEFSHLMDMIKEEDDAITADVIIQTVFLGEIVYG